MKQQEKIETEGFRNQAMTSAAASRLREEGKARPKKKVVALQLDDREQEALRFLGGVEGLKRLLCPPGLCLCCRERPAVEGSWKDSLCSVCASEEGAR